MIVAVYLSIYAGLLVFICGSAWRAYRYANLPLHLRWELYPVPHEEARRARYGGSYFEEQHWAGKPQHRNLLGEWRAMAEEILLLKSLRDFNRSLWVPSFLFHFGIYLSSAAVLLFAVAGLKGHWLSGLDWVATASAAAGLTGAGMIVAGAGMLLVRRMTDPALRNSTSPGDVFNLLFFLVAFVLLASGYMIRAPETATLAEFARGALYFDRGLKIGSGFGAGLILVSALAAYIPFTHMAHYVAKYFTWHGVRWDDRRSEKGSPMEREAAMHLAAAPTWAAPHIDGDGQQCWAEIATNSPREGRR